MPSNTDLLLGTQYTLGDGRRGMTFGLPAAGLIVPAAAPGYLELSPFQNLNIITTPVWTGAFVNFSPRKAVVRLAFSVGAGAAVTLETRLRQYVDGVAQQDIGWSNQACVAASANNPLEIGFADVNGQNYAFSALLGNVLSANGATYAALPGLDTRLAFKNNNAGDVTITRLDVVVEE